MDIFMGKTLIRYATVFTIKHEKMSQRIKITSSYELSETWDKWNSVKSLIDDTSVLENKKYQKNTVSWDRDRTFKDPVDEVLTFAA